MSPADPYRISVVCTGNICRSPIGEVVLRAKLADARLADRVVVDSFGTGDWHVGDGADPRTVKVLRRHGYDGTAHRARTTPRDLAASRDLVLVADNSHLRTLLAETTHDADRDRIRLLREFDPAATAAGTLEVDDPWHGGDADFERCLAEVSAACDGLVDYLVTELDH